MDTPASARDIFPFFKLPAEIRLKIYRYAMEMARENREIIFRLPTDPYSSDTTTSSSSTSNDHLVHYNAGHATTFSPTNLRARFAVIPKLGSICQQIRSEAYHEFFEHTKIVLRYDPVLDPFVGFPRSDPIRTALVNWLTFDLFFEDVFVLIAQSPLLAVQIRPRLLVLEITSSLSYPPSTPPLLCMDSCNESRDRMYTSRTVRDVLQCWVFNTTTV